MFRSKVKASGDERVEVGKLWMATSAPVFYSSAHMRAREVAHRRTHEIALAHGLPEQEGFYGLDLETGEFLSQYPIKEPA